MNKYIWVIRFPQGRTPVRIERYNLLRETDCYYYLDHHGYREERVRKVADPLHNTKVAFSQEEAERIRYDWLNSKLEEYERQVGRIATEMAAQVTISDESTPLQKVKPEDLIL